VTPETVLPTVVRTARSVQIAPFDGIEGGGAASRPLSPVAAVRFPPAAGNTARAPRAPD